jgi:hypothetical protein
MKQPIKKTIKLKHQVIVRAPSLLPMLYKVSELSIELGIPDRTIRDWIAMGAPAIRDTQNHIWVNGKEFSCWVSKQRPSPKSYSLTDSQAYCFRCKEIVEMKNILKIPIKGKLVHFRGICQKCGITINRGGRIGQADQPTKLLMD